MRHMTMVQRGRALLVGTAAVALAGGAVVLAPSASADEVRAGEVSIQGECGDNFNPTVPGGKAHWELSCANGKITIEGNVQDTRADGKCVKVAATMPNGDVKRSAAACPKGDKETFKWTGTGRQIDAKLYTYDV